MDEQQSDRLAWVEARRRENGLGVACREAQGDGVPCDCPEGQCELCDHSAEAFAKTAPPPVANPLMDPGYG
jgi:hypothetical protein